jgi:hypothetical protein
MNTGKILMGKCPGEPSPRLLRMRYYEGVSGSRLYSKVIFGISHVETMFTDCL